MKYNPDHASYLPILIKVLQISEGPVLVLGVGLYSTPLTHWLCQEAERRLVTYENNQDQFRLFEKFGYGLHKLKLIKDWESAPIEEEHWGVAFVDHNPAKRRSVEIARLAKITDYIVVHDSESLNNSFSLFKYSYHHKRQRPQTSVLSNFTDFYL